MGGGTVGHCYCERVDSSRSEQLENMLLATVLIIMTLCTCLFSATQSGSRTPNEGQTSISEGDIYTSALSQGVFMFPCDAPLPVCLFRFFVVCGAKTCSYIFLHVGYSVDSMHSINKVSVTHSLIGEPLKT